jgi:hypothetical protein
MKTRVNGQIKAPEVRAPERRLAAGFGRPEIQPGGSRLDVGR